MRVKYLQTYLNIESDVKEWVVCVRAEVAVLASHLTPQVATEYLVDCRRILGESV